jgi:hypothetical protein
MLWRGFCLAGSPFLHRGCRHRPPCTVPAAPPFALGRAVSFLECEIEADSCFFESADSRSVGAMTKLAQGVYAKIAPTDVRYEKVKACADKAWGREYDALDALIACRPKTAGSLVALIAYVGKPDHRPLQSQQWRRGGAYSLAHKESPRPHPAGAFAASPAALGYLGGPRTHRMGRSLFPFKELP